MAEKVEKLVECLKKKCEADDTAISLSNEMNKFEKKISHAGKITMDDVEELRALAKRVDEYNINIENTQCMVTKCVEEYIDLMESNLKVTAERMRALAENIKGMLESTDAAVTQVAPTKKPKAGKAGKAATKASTKPESESKPESKPESATMSGSKPKPKSASKTTSKPKSASKPQSGSKPKSGSMSGTKPKSGSKKE